MVFLKRFPFPKKWAKFIFVLLTATLPLSTSAEQYYLHINIPGIEPTASESSAFSVVTAKSALVESANIDIGGAGNNRIVVLVAMEARNPASIQGATLNGVSGHVIVSANFPDFSTDLRNVVYVWFDADLPDAAGTYPIEAIKYSGGEYRSAILYAEGASQSTPTSYATKGSNPPDDAPEDTTITLTGASPDAISIMALSRIGWSDNLIAGEGQIEHLVDGEGGYRFWASYEKSDNQPTYGLTINEYAAIAVAIEPASSM